MDEQVVEWWLSKALTYGIGTVFMASVLFGLLWVSATLVRILTARLPGWFDDQARTNASVRAGMEALVRHTTTINSHTDSTRKGLRSLARASHQLLSEHGQRLGIGNEVAMHVRDAKAALKNGDPDDE